jgi:hypothetical protein
MLKPGTQLTFLTIYEKGTVSVNTAAGAKEASLSDFAINRIAITDAEAVNPQVQDVNDAWKVKNDVTANATSVTIVNANGDEITISCSETETGGAVCIEVSPKVAAVDTNCGGALILSRYENGIWKRNSASIEIGFMPKNIYTFEDWLSVYQTTGAASKKYLNNGNEGTGIKG